MRCLWICSFKLWMKEGSGEYEIDPKFHGHAISVNACPLVVK